MAKKVKAAVAVDAEEDLSFLDAEQKNNSDETSSSPVEGEEDTSNEEQVADEEMEAPATTEREPLYVGNTSTTRRGFMLKRGQVVLEPYEIKRVPDEDVEEVRKLFSARSMQALIDEGYFQVGSSPIVQVKQQKTATPPGDLNPSSLVKSTGSAAVAGTSTKQIGGTDAMKLDSVVNIQ